MNGVLGKNKMVMEGGSKSNNTCQTTGGPALTNELPLYSVEELLETMTSRHAVSLTMHACPIHSCIDGFVQ